jgi:hypothetical protein
MFKPLMPVPMCVRLAWRIIRQVLMLVMLVMRMFMRVRQRLVNVPVFVRFRYVQPDTKSHKKTCSQ